MIPFRKTLLASVVGTSLLATAMPALADSKTSNAALLRLIQQQAEEIKQLEKRLAAVEAEKPAAAQVAATPAPAAPAPDDKSAEVQAAVADSQQTQLDTLQAQVAQIAAGGSSGGGGSIDWSDGTPQFRSPDGFFTFQPRVRLMFDFSSTHGSAYDDRNINGTEARELRLGAVGDIGQLSYKLDVDFAGQVTSVKEAWLRYGIKAFDVPVDFYLGNKLKDRTIDGSTQLTYVPFMERNAVASLSGGVNSYFGLGAFLKAYGSNWHFAASITGDDLNNVGDASDSIMYSVRSHWNPLMGAQGFVHVGGWYYYEKIARDVATINNTPIIAQDFNQNLRVSAGSITDPTRDEAYGFELGGVYRSFWGFGEYAHRRIQDSTFALYDRHATSFSAGWLLTGEKPGFSSRNGTWTATTVLSPVTSGGWGAWEIAARVDRYDFTDAPKGGDAHSTTFGVNWYFNNWARLMFEYVDWNTNNKVGSYQGPDDGNSIGMRAQLAF